MFKIATVQSFNLKNMNDFARGHRTAHVLRTIITHEESRLYFFGNTFFLKITQRKNSRGFMSGLLGGHFCPIRWRAGYQWQIHEPLYI